MIKENINGLGEFEFYQNYFIGRINEGSNAGTEYVDALSDLIQKHFSGRPVIYISDRVNCYSLDPVATADLIARNEITHVGIVVYSQLQGKTYSFLEKFLEETKICSFESLDAAMSWAEQKSLDPN